MQELLRQAAACKSGNECGVLTASLCGGVQVTFRNTFKYKHDKELFIAPEGVYSGQVRPGARRMGN